MSGITSVCVYCGSRKNVKQSYIDAAEKLGKRLAQKDMELVYGGGQVGLMGLVADATMNNGGKVYGVIPHFLDDVEGGHDNLTEIVFTENMHDRKMKMAERAESFIALPGGLGTLDETFEILTWRQLGLHDKPIIILNIDGYWDYFVKLIHSMVDEGFVEKEHLELFHVVETVDEAIAFLEHCPVPSQMMDSARA